MRTSSPPRAFGHNQMRGVNIGNALDAPSPGEWGVEIRQDYFDEIRHAGFNTVRLPVRFSAHIQAQPPYKVDDSFLQIVKSAVDDGLGSDLYVILDLHHFDELMEKPEENEEKFLALWDQISRNFSSYPENLYYEILNEPSKELSPQRWNDLLLRIIRVIRINDPNRTIIVDTAEYASIEVLKSLKLPADENLVVTFHLYSPFEFTHQGAGWVEGSRKWMGKKWNGEKDEKAQISSILDEAAAWSSSRKIPIVIGEFGTIELADKESRLRWTGYVAREAEKRDIGWIYWQFCSNFAVYSCTDNHWDTDILGALIPIKASR
jgi:endoglucanase